jgi:hypothetical protein
MRSALYTAVACASASPCVRRQSATSAAPSRTRFRSHSLRVPAMAAAEPKARPPPLDFERIKQLVKDVKKARHARGQRGRTSQLRGAACSSCGARRMRQPAPARAFRPAGSRASRRAAAVGPTLPDPARAAQAELREHRCACAHARATELGWAPAADAPTPRASHTPPRAHTQNVVISALPDVYLKLRKARARLRMRTLAASPRACTAPCARAAARR